MFLVNFFAIVSAGERRVPGGFYRSVNIWFSARNLYLTFCSSAAFTVFSNGKQNLLPAYKKILYLFTFPGLYVFIPADSQ
jgi:hypothetical protein